MTSILTWLRRPSVVEGEGILILSLCRTFNDLPGCLYFDHHIESCNQDRDYSGVDLSFSSYYYCVTFPVVNTPLKFNILSKRLF